MINGANGDQMEHKSNVEDVLAIKPIKRVAGVCITGDVDGSGVPVSNPNGPLDHKLFLVCARDTVKLLCNHSSLALLVEDNEQHPPEDINAALKNDLQFHPFCKSSEIGTNLIDSPIWTKAYEDPSRYLDGTRLYIHRSLWDGFAKGNGDFTDGPYEIQYPEDFFEDDFYQYGFNPEVVSVSMPVAATIRATMSPEAWKIPLFQRLKNGYINILNLERSMIKLNCMESQRA